MKEQVSAHRIRAHFAQEMSRMYREEVPQYATLCDLVAEVNASVLALQPTLSTRLSREGQLERIDVERHGAVRVGTPAELRMLGRLFAVMGMHPVGYYDLSIAGIPVHSTAFRPLDDASLAQSPFRVFASLLRLELLADANLRAQASEVLARREIFNADCLALIEQSERDGGLNEPQADDFVRAALETFRWHSEATVDLPTYRRMRDAHPLVADIVCFKGPHINHLTPRTLDIDAVHSRMEEQGLRAKDSIEGPPPRAFPLLLRQTSFLALDEGIRFIADGDEGVEGTHVARFGEIEQRGCALTAKGRALYDRLLAQARRSGQPLAQALRDTFREFPDDAQTLHREGLAFFRYQPAPNPPGRPPSDLTATALVEGGWLRLEPMIYEDFLPVSAAGIFRSNLGEACDQEFSQAGSQLAFEAALGRPLHNELEIYASQSQSSFAAALHQLSDKTAGSQVP